MVEHRDDFETLPSESPSNNSSHRVGCFPFDSILNVPINERCRVSSLCQSVDSRVGLSVAAATGAHCNNDSNNLNEEEDKPLEEEIIEANDDDDENNNNNSNLSPLNDTRMELEDERLDLNSVLSGNDDATAAMMSIEDQDGGDGGGVSVKNLSRLFEENDNKPITIANTATANHVRPPLAPGRSNLKTEESAGGIKKSNDDGDDKRLSVYLRIRPPVSSTGKEGVDGAISTIEVLNADETAATTTTSSLPSTIRTYPPLTSNAAKVVRSNNNKMTKRNTSKSFNEDITNNRNGSDENSGEVLGVKEYAYSGVFGPNSTQSDIYESVAFPMVEGLFPEDANNGELGESALLFTLGVTNAGKTHTVMGTGFEKKKKGDKVNYTTPHKDWGIIPRSLHHILSRVENLNNTTAPSSCGGPKLQLFMSYLEIYNEAIYDLLPDKTKQPGSKRPFDGPPALKLRESRRGRIFVRGLARHPVNNVQEGLDLAEEAKKNRHTSNNNINSASSRSHSICQFEIAYYRQSSNKSRGGASDAESCSEYESDDDCSVSSAGSKKGRNSTIIWIVDLAGSERSKRTGAISHTRHQKEAALINASLMNLMRCLREMLNHQPKKRGTNKGAGVVPFRESKLTHMFMNHLTGPSASRTSMIVNVNPAADDFDETQHVLSYATTARSVKISMVDYSKKHRILAKESNVKLSPVKKIKELVKKFSPQKRKGISSDSKPAAKRLRTNNTVVPNKRAAGPFVAKSASIRPASAKSQRGGNDEIEKLREENFSLGITIDDLEQQLANCEEEIRAEVVAMMNEQLQESKEWYEGRIENLKQQLKNMQATNSKQASNDYDAKKREDDLFERINECEEEMTRMRDEHKEELDEKSAELLNVTNIHAAEMEQASQELHAEREEKEHLLAENGALRHQAKEIQASHDAILAKYNELFSRMKNDSPDTFASLDPEPTELASPNPHHTKLPRERCSGVASTTAPLDVKTDTPKNKKGNKWRIFSPKSAKKLSPNAAVGQKLEKDRSPLGDVNHSRIRHETND